MKRLLEIQTKLKAPKGNYNSFGKYKYRSAEDILTAVKPLLEEVGLVMVISDNIQQFEDRYYVEALVTIFDENKEVVAQTRAYARESETKKGMDGSQITGTASSYARKYALNGMFLIDDTKDADTDEYHKQTSDKVPSLSSLKAMFDTALTEKEKTDTLAHYDVEDITGLSDEQKIELGTALAKKLKNKEEK